MIFEGAILRPCIPGPVDLLGQQNAAATVSFLVGVLCRYGLGQSAPVPLRSRSATCEVRDILSYSIGGLR